MEVRRSARLLWWKMRSNSIPPYSLHRMEHLQDNSTSSDASDLIDICPVAGDHESNDCRERHLPEKLGHVL